MKDRADNSRQPYFWILWALAYVVMAGYAIVRPASESLFIEAYGAKSFPWVWLVVAVVVTLTVGVYNRSLARRHLVSVFERTCVISAVTMAAVLVAVRYEVPGAVFVLYVLKDIYIVVLVELFWSMANTLFDFRTAKKTYGRLCLMGAVGGITGNLGGGVLADAIGTAATLWVAPAVLLFGVVLVRPLWKQPGLEVPERGGSVSWTAGLTTVRSSRYLGLLVAMIAVVQMAITFVDYQFMTQVEQAYPDTDQRTLVISLVYSAIDAFQIPLQLLTVVVLSAFGVSKTLLAIPLLLGACVAGFIAVPRFAMMVIVKVVSKSLDYSLFRAAKEMLYLPLSYQETTQGKHVVDVMTYRVAKGLASFLLLLLVTEGSSPLIAVFLALGAIAAWVAVTLPVVSRYRAVEAETQTHIEGAVS